jgi:hypothetical protein
VNCRLTGINRKILIQHGSASSASSGERYAVCCLRSGSASAAIAVIDRTETFDDIRKHDIPLDRDRSPDCRYLAECVLYDRHSALLDCDYDNRADLSVSSYDIASPFRGSVSLDGWPERDVVVQFIVCQVDRFLDETAVRYRHLNVAFCTFTIPANGTNVW